MKWRREKRECGGVGGGRRTESTGLEGHMFCERIQKIKTSAATFQMLLYFTLLDRRGDIISCNILPQYSYQGRSTLQACVTFPTPSCADPKPGDLCTKCSSVSMC